MTIALTVFQGRAGESDDLAIPGAKSSGEVLARELAPSATTIGTPKKSLGANWRIELSHAITPINPK